MTKHKLKGHQVDVSAKAIAKYLWLSFSITILVDGDEEFASSDKMEGLKSTIPFQMKIDESETLGELRTKIRMFFRSVSYSIYIDDKEVANGKCVCKNWYLTQVSSCLLGLGLYGMMLYIT